MSDSDEEIVQEDDPSRLDADEAEADEGPAAIQKLRERLKKAVEEKQEYLEGWQRARADFVNFKREEAAMHAEKEARLRTKFVEELIPMLDSFDITLRNDAPAELKKGIAPIYQQFLVVLKNLGVEQIGMEEGGKGLLIGRPFDPTQHEAIQEIENPPELEHMVVKVFRSGYKMGNTTIRPAQVAIGIVKK